MIYAISKHAVFDIDSGTGITLENVMSLGSFNGNMIFNYNQSFWPPNSYPLYMQDSKLYYKRLGLVYYIGDILGYSDRVTLSVSYIRNEVYVPRMYHLFYLMVI